MANKVFLCGRLTKDCEVRQSVETKVARYTLAVDRKYSKGEEKQTDFINIVAFGKSAEFAEKYLKKGMKILVTGRIQTGSYTDKDSKKVYTTDIVAEDQEFCESKGNSTQNERPTTDDDFMDIPANVKDDMPF